jgi:hypothetical protein
MPPSAGSSSPSGPRGECAGPAGEVADPARLTKTRLQSGLI